MGTFGVWFSWGFLALAIEVVLSMIGGFVSALGIVKDDIDLHFAGLIMTVIGGVLYLDTYAAVFLWASGFLIFDISMSDNKLLLLLIPTAILVGWVAV